MSVCCTLPTLSLGFFCNPGGMGRGKQHPYRGKQPRACSHCKRRKERCDGRSPCGRCIYRNVAFECQPAVPKQQSTSTHAGKLPSASLPSHLDANSLEGDNGHEAFNELELQTSNEMYSTSADWAFGNSPPAPKYGQMSRMLRDPRGKYMFIGDSANLSFLQSIRKVVEGSIGACAFTRDPLRYQMVEATPTGQSSFLQLTAREPAPSFTLEQATYLIRRYFLATTCVLDLFDEEDLLENLPAWLERTSVEMDVLTPTYYLVFAIGAQTCPEDKDDLAEICFSHGRYLSFTEEPSISTVQAYALITFYLLNASRRNAAFMNLGTAVRAAYALGVHLKGISALFPPAEFKTRERLWRVIRILDLFLSTSLGRPPSTAETRDTRSSENFSAGVDLCSMFETILNEVYSKRMISAAALEKLSEHHRQWASCFQQGLAEDGIQPTVTLDGGKWPNIGLLHLKEAYYWTIMLLTRPFLLEAVPSSAITANTYMTPMEGTGNRATWSKTQVLVHACVDSAIRTIELLRILLEYDDIPKRLPFVVNCIFVSALVLGLAHFGDVGKLFPIEEHLKLAHRLLGIFPHDALARRNMAIVEHLMRACDTITEKRAELGRDRYSSLVKGMFGSVDEDQTQRSAVDPASSNIPPSTTYHLGTSSHGIGESLPMPVDQASSQGSTVQHDRTSHGLVQMSGTGMGTGTGIPGTTVPGHLGGREGIAADPFMEYSVAPEGFEEALQLMSPTTLWFDSYDESFPLFSTTDLTAS